MENKPTIECRSMTVDECRATLGLGRSSMYTLVKTALKTGKPFTVTKLGGHLLVSKRSFNDYLEQMGF